MDVAELTDGAVLTEQTVTGTWPADQPLPRGADLEACTLRGVVAQRARFTGWTLSECTLDGCDLSMAQVVDTRFVQCHFVGCKALAVGWSAGSLTALSPEPVRFDRCQLAMGTFSGMDLRGAVFDSCDLGETDFTGADLRGASFPGSRLDQARFVDADLRGARMVGATGLTLDPRTARVEGLVVDPGEALALVAALGIDLA